MKPVYQTTFGEGKDGQEPGNCFAACLASLLELEIADVPNFVAHRDWFLRCQTWLNDQGYGIVMVDWPNVTYAGQFPKMPLVISGWGPRGLRHSIVGRVEFKSPRKMDRGSSPGQLAAMPEGAFEQILLACTKNPDIVSACGNVLIAESKSPDEASGAGLVRTGTSVPYCQEGQSPQGSGKNSLPQNSITRCQDVGETSIPTGMVADPHGEASHGSALDGKRSAEQQANVLCADHLANSKSTTVKAGHRLADTGTTSKKTSKSGVRVVTSQNTDRHGSMQPARCVVQSTSPGPRMPVVRKPAVEFPSFAQNPAGTPNDNPENFWEAARQILDQVYLCLKPGGHAVWVVRAFVRKGKIVDFPAQWRQLCEAVGFRTLHCHRAWLVEDKGTDLTLEGGEQRLTKENKSFFRRLAERKGAPRIDYEIVLCMKRI